MADIDRDVPDQRHKEQIHATGSGGTTGWWIAGILALAVLIIGFFAFSGGNPAPIEGTQSTPAPATELAPAPQEDGATAPSAEDTPAAAPAEEPAAAQ